MENNTEINNQTTQDTNNDIKTNFISASSKIIEGAKKQHITLLNQGIALLPAQKKNDVITDNKITKGGYRVTHWVIGYGCFEAIEALIDKGVDFNLTNAGGYLPVTTLIENNFCSEEQKLATLEKLIQFDINIQLMSNTSLSKIKNDGYGNLTIKLIKDLMDKEEQLISEIKDYLGIQNARPIYKGKKIVEIENEAIQKIRSEIKKELEDAKVSIKLKIFVDRLKSLLKQSLIGVANYVNDFKPSIRPLDSNASLFDKIKNIAANKIVDIAESKLDDITHNTNIMSFSYEQLIRLLNFSKNNNTENDKLIKPIQKIAETYKGSISILSTKEDALGTFASVLNYRILHYLSNAKMAEPSKFNEYVLKGVINGQAPSMLEEQTIRTKIKIQYDENADTKENMYITTQEILNRP